MTIPQNCKSLISNIQRGKAFAILRTIRVTDSALASDSARRFAEKYSREVGDHL